MSNNYSPSQADKSQSKFAANLNSDAHRRSEYIGTNFGALKEVRELHVNHQDYDATTVNQRINFDDYYAGLRAGDNANDNSHDMVKGSFKDNMASYIFHFALLLVAVICGSSVSVFYFYIQPTSQLLKASWRLLFLAMCISPLAIFEYFKEKHRFLYSAEVLWNGQLLKKILIASIGHTIWTIALVIAVNHTSMAQATILIGLHPIMLMGWKVIQKSNVMRLEIIGSISAIVGVILIFFDNDIGSSREFVDFSLLSSLTRKHQW